MTPAQHDGWKLLLDLGDESVSTWCLVGGQMVWLLAAEYRAPYAGTRNGTGLTPRFSCH
jgi:hypothetical protein